MKSELIYEYEIGQGEVKEIMESYPSTIDYYSFVASKLGCEIKDLSLLNVLPEFEDEDEEGWEIKSFFPRDAKLDITKISDNYHVFGFTFGEVFEVVYNGETFIAESSASPFLIWAKYLD